jgi:phage shock protein PspC (stress-responsive transcriptional regulator)
MALTDELERLGALHAQGRLSDDEFAQAKARVLHGGDSPPVVAAVNRFRRSRSDRWIAGVCGGIGAATGVESWVWRLILALLALFGGTGVLLYILLWMFVPDE